MPDSLLVMPSRASDTVRPFSLIQTDNPEPSKSSDDFVRALAITFD